MKCKQFTLFSIGLAGLMLAGCGDDEFSKAGFKQDSFRWRDWCLSRNHHELVKGKP